MASDTSITVANNASAVDAVWILVSTFLVFYMQTGFTMLEVGSAQTKHSMNIIIKNLGDAVIGIFMYYAIGYGLAYGPDGNWFVGSGYFFLVGIPKGDLAGFLFQASFSIASATIVSGAMVGRARYVSYFVVTTIMTSVTYPVVSHWVWDAKGWLSTGLETPLNGSGMIDFAGSGVVHLVGGVAALIGAKMLGPREGRYVRGKRKELEQHSFVLVAMATMILWFAWFGFNAGSSVTVTQGRYAVAGLAAVNTMLGGAGAGVGMMALSLMKYRKLQLMPFLNAVLGGLVSVTAGCAVIPPWAALVAGFLAAGVYWLGAVAEEHLEVDDPVEAFPVHGMCGVWGLVVVGLFANGADVADMLAVSKVGPAQMGLLMGGDGSLVVTQMLGAGCIVLWVGVVTFLAMSALNKYPGLRVELALERAGLNLEHDVTDHHQRTRLLDQWAKYVEKQAAEMNDDGDDTESVVNSQVDGVSVVELDSRHVSKGQEGAGVRVTEVV